MVRISGFSLTTNTENSVDSEIFIVGDYKWRICLFPNGNTLTKSLGYISMYVQLVNGKGLLQVSCSFALVDPSNANISHRLCHPYTNVYNNLDSSGTKLADGWGLAKLIERKKLEEHPSFRDDSFTIKCTITILKEFRVDVAEDAPSMAATKIVPPLDLQKDLVSLLESGLGADVSFNVGTKTFNAHRCILAARSPVFRAQLFGPLKESTNRRIVIDDMEAHVFKAMLHFMYSDSESYSYLENEDFVPTMAQHLLVAADRYELERLRQVCEEQLRKSIDVATVATTLVLAEQHGCRQLKAACLKFMTSRRVLHAVSLTEGFQHLCLSCPSIAKHLSLLENICHVKVEG